MPPIEIKPDIYWIGVNDRTTDLFEELWPITKKVARFGSYGWSGGAQRHFATVAAQASASSSR